jgi:hypothetical protein
LQNGAIESAQIEDIVASQVTLRKESGFIAKASQKLILTGKNAFNFKKVSYHSHFICKI